MQYRLFNRGHKEEARFTEWLRAAGYVVQDVNPETGKQWRITGYKGHFGGSCDGIAWLPAKYEYTKPFLLEYKTNGTGPAFSKLIKDGCAVGKPVHFDQQSIYGYKLNLEYSIYLNVCKNDDNIHSEVIKLDWNRGADLEKKASIVIDAIEPPVRISQNKTAMACKFCEFVGPCFDGIPYDRNCRSCTFVRAVEDGLWHCTKWQANPPEDVIPLGCDQWSPAT